MNINEIATTAVNTDDLLETPFLRFRLVPLRIEVLDRFRRVGHIRRRMTLNIKVLGRHPRDDER